MLVVVAVIVLVVTYIVTAVAAAVSAAVLLECHSGTSAAWRNPRTSGYAQLGLAGVRDAAAQQQQQTMIAMAGNIAGP